ncbi:hypothetical protein ABJI51_11665 [Amycolatopsis sp. NEAU-NG30]|jgi:hypothetical protein|uniref:Uncharacterized protein n=1 Tax=Amycolatopsis melonis TaxID=3156488 RepID=A0ABV0LE24_9PSEU
MPDTEDPVAAQRSSGRPWWPWVTGLVLVAVAAVVWILAPHRYGLPIGLFLLAVAVVTPRLPVRRRPEAP